MSMNKMVAKAFAVVIVLALALCVPALQKRREGNVVIGYYAESLCPDCIAFSNGPLTKAFQQASIKLHDRNNTCMYLLL